MISFLENNSKAHEEYESFVSTHEYGSFMQSLAWANVKKEWQSDILIYRGGEGKIGGSMHVLTRKIPFLGTSMMYSPRGPVCHPDEKQIIKMLMDSVKALAKEKKAHIFRCDPEVEASDLEYISLMETLGFEHFSGGLDFDATIQPRFNYRLPLKDEDGNQRQEEEVLASFHHKTRYNTRLAGRRGVTVEVREDRQALEDFVRLMKVTGDRDGFNVRPLAYFENFLEAMGEHARLYMAYFEGQAVSGAITTQYAKKTCYVYGASDNEHRNVMPNYLLQWEMIKWGIENENDIYDFQGVSGDESKENPLYGLYRFKSGFSGETVELAGEFKQIFRPTMNKVFNALIKIRGKFL